jgi:hypothetical protein
VAGHGKLKSHDPMLINLVDLGFPHDMACIVLIAPRSFKLCVWGLPIILMSWVALVPHLHYQGNAGEVAASKSARGLGQGVSTVSFNL